MCYYCNSRRKNDDISTVNIHISEEIAGKVELLESKPDVSEASSSSNSSSVLFAG